MSNKLTFETFRRANVTRIPTFKNKQGDPAHSETDGSDWSLADWMNATVGELGELANVLKKIKRGDYADPKQAKIDAAKELADVQTYLSILGFRMSQELGCDDLEDAVIDKFNEVSERVNSPIMLKEGGHVDLREYTK